jgi:hypothetical protein
VQHWHSALFLTRLYGTHSRYTTEAKPLRVPVSCRVEHLGTEATGWPHVLFRPHHSGAQDVPIPVNHASDHPQSRTKVAWESTRLACLCHVCLHCTQDDVEVKLMMGDELRLRHKCPAGRPAWEGTGHVIVTGGSSEEVSSDLGVALGIISSWPPPYTSRVRFSNSCCWAG